MKEHAEESGISYTWFKQIVQHQGIETALIQTIDKTNIERAIERMLMSNGIEFSYNNRSYKHYIPDFLIEDSKLIVETNGLYWHSDSIKKDKKYHFKKKLFFESKGYRIVFFNSNEIEKMPEIVESIILNKCGKINERFYARKLKITIQENKASSVFFNENHLMGNHKTSNLNYSLCDYDNTILAGMQAKWKSKSNKILDITRFCTKRNIAVAGGYSRLLTKIIKDLNPKKIVTFVDERYGYGDYLAKLGFRKEKSYLSFIWTDGENVYHRMRFRGNTGYEKGLNKVWDCGQALYTLDLAS